MERRHIARVLATEGGNISNAAKVLRINRTTLYHKIKKYGLRLENGQPSGFLTEHVGTLCQPVRF